MTASSGGPSDDSHLGVEHLQQGLRGRSVSGALVTLAAQWMRFLLHLGSLAILARLLSPGDFGLIGMVVAVTGLLLTLKDLGLAAATVQRHRLTQAQVSGLFWVNLALSLAAVLLAVALAPLLATFYGEPRLVGITLALSGALVLSGLSVQHRAVLSRQMRFRALAGLELAAQAAGVLVAIVAAWRGAGYWALVLQALTLHAVGTAGSWILCGWRPGPFRRGSGLRPLIRFGGYATGFGIANYVARNLDDVLVGRFFGDAALGLYSRAYGMLMLPLRQINEPISKIAIPVLSRLQDQPERYRRYYLQAVGWVGLATMPLTACLFVLSHEVVAIVLGPQWDRAAELFSILALVALVQPVLNTGGWVFVSLGQTDRWFRWGLISATVTGTAFVIGLAGGVRGVALAYAVAVYSLAVPQTWFTMRRSPMDLLSVARVVARPLVLSLVMGGAAWGARLWALPAAPWRVVAIALAAAAAGGTAVVLIWPALRCEVLRLPSLLRELRQGESAPESPVPPDSPAATRTTR